MLLFTCTLPMLALEAYVCKYSVSELRKTDLPNTFVFRPIVHVISWHCFSTIYSVNEIVKLKID